MGFVGGPGTGKTAHATALAKYLGIPLIVLSPATAGITSADCRTVLRQAFDHAKKRGSAVLLVDEIDVYTARQDLFAELRQLIDGAYALPRECGLYVVATTNQPQLLPYDLVQRTIVAINFGGCVSDPSPKPSGSVVTKASTGTFDETACRAFWRLNAMHLPDHEQHLLAQTSAHFFPRELALVTRRAQLSAAHHLMTCVGQEEGRTPAHIYLPRAGVSELVKTHTKSPCVPAALHESNEHSGPCYKLDTVPIVLATFVEGKWSVKGKQSLDSVISEAINRFSTTVCINDYLEALEGLKHGTLSTPSAAL